MRTALASFDARLQAELLNGWDSEVLSRAGLSAVVFEQKLRTARDPSAAGLRVLPSSFLVFSVLDQYKKQLRVFVNRVDRGMTLGDPQIFAVKNADSIANELPGEVAKHVAHVAGLSPNANQVEEEVDTKKSLVCALLEPTSSGGANADIGQVSTLIRAVLESLISSEAVGATLVDRSESSRLLEEKSINAVVGLNPNGASDLGRMAKADLILIPFIHFKNLGQIHTDLFAADVATGRMLACRSWMGGLLDSPPASAINELLIEAVRAASESSQHSVVDTPELRHAEADFLIGLKKGWNGLRQLVASEAELSIRLGDAALALSSDNEIIMRRAAKLFYRDATPAAPYPLAFEYSPDDSVLGQVKALKDSGQLSLIQKQARQVFELPMTELARNNSDDDLRVLAELLIRLGDAEKAWSLLTRGGQSIQELAAKSPYYETMVVALMNLGRYQECVDLLLNRKRWNSSCTTIMLDAYRALGNTDREFGIMRDNLKSACKTEHTTSRFLELGVEKGLAGPVIGSVISTANSWIVSSPVVRNSMIRARVAAGQKELAIADAQCAHIAATKIKDQGAQKELQAILSELGGKPIESLPIAREFVSLPKDGRIDLIHDQSVDENYVGEIATHVARFWGCPVHVRSIDIQASKFSCYQKLSQALDANVFADSFTQVDLPEGASFGTILLTQTKLISRQKDYSGDVYSVKRGSVKFLSDHYIRKFKGSDPRPLPLITAIAAADLSIVSRLLRLQSAEQDSSPEAFSPLPPDLFSPNGNLHLIGMDLGISPATGALLKNVPSSRILEAVAESKEKFREKAPSVNPSDRNLILDLSKQISEATPIVVDP